jgi:polar amino acid transport system substrate-binding protein
MINKLKFKELYVFLFCCYIYSFPIFSQNIEVVTEEFPPYNFTENGKIVGVSTEVVRAVFDKLNLDADISMYPWERAYHMALQQQSTLIYSIIRNDKRESLFQWIDVVAPLQACLFSLKSNENIEITNLSDIIKYSFITNRNGAIAQKLHEQGLVDKGNLRKTISINDNFTMLLTGRVDLLASTKMALYHLISDRGYEAEDVVSKLHCFDLGGLYMAFSLNTPEELVEKFRRALSEFKTESGYQDIINKHFN